MVSPEPDADITTANVIRKNRASTSNPDVYRFP
jgi:hypothetical protein